MRRGEGLADRGERRAIERDLPFERGQGRVPGNGPGVADARHALHHLVIAGGHDDGRARLLEGAHGEMNVL